MPKFFNSSNWPEFQGAFILDTIMNYNQTEGSQNIPDDWRGKIPKAYEETRADGFRGDFLSMVGRRGPEAELSNLMEKHWRRLQGDRDHNRLVSHDTGMFKLRRFDLSLGADIPPLEDLADHIHFLRSDHTRFWYTNETDYQLSLRAVLLTDTGKIQGVQAVRKYS